jgi:hypothetical protein
MLHDPAMKQTTREATLVDVNDLLDRVPHANLAFETSAGIDAIPVGFQRIEGQLWVGIRNSDANPSVGQQAMLLIDDGRYYFELRGLRVRGMLRDAPAPPSLDQAFRWLELEPVKINAWNYGSMRARVNP